MAAIQTQEKTKTQGEFLAWVVRELDHGTIDPAVAIEQGATYEDIQQFYVENPHVVTWALQDESSARLRSLFSDPRIVIPEPPVGAETLTQFGPTTTTTDALPTRPISPARTRATKQMRQTFLGMRQQKIRQQAENAKKIAHDWVEELRKRRLYDQKQEKQVEQVAQINFTEPVYARSEKEAQDELVHRFTQTPTFSTIKPQVATITKTVLTKHPQTVASLWAKTETITTHAFFANEDVISPTVVAQAIDSGLSEEQSISLARATEVVTQARTAPEGINSFAFPKTPQKGEQAALVRTLTHAAGDDGIVGGIILRLGEGVATREEIGAFIRDGANSLAGQAPTGGTGGSIISNLFTVGQPKSEEVTQYVSALYKHKLTHATTEVFPSFMEFLLVRERINNPGSFTTTSSGLLRYGAEAGMQKGAKAALGLGANATAKQIGAAAVAKFLPSLVGTAIAGPLGTAIGVVITLFGGKILEWGGKIVSGTIGAAGYLLSGGVLTSILQGKPASLLDTFVLLPIILVGMVIALFVFPWFMNLQQFPDTVRRTALVEHMSGGAPGPEAPKCLIMAITATPTGPVDKPTAIEYTVSVSPTCEGSLVVNEASVSFSSIGATTATIAPQVITGAQLSSGSFSFTIPVGPQLNDSVIAATFTLSATVGATSTSGVVTTATVIGNPVNDILIPGNAGFPPMGWCVGTNTPASIAWTDADWDTMQGALAALSAYGNFLDIVRSINSNGIIVYRYDLTGGIWGCTASGNPPIMGIYNNGIAHAVYILAHEFGHRIAASYLGEFKAQGIMSEGITEYASHYTNPEDRVGEDFAESFALFVTGGLGNLPNHYNFVKRILGIP